MTAPVLTVDALIAQLQALSAAGNGESPVVIQYDPGFATMGGTPAVGISGSSAGFDWNQGKVFLHTDKPVGAVGEDLEKVRRQIATMTSDLFNAGSLARRIGTLPDEELVKRLGLWHQELQERSKRKRPA